MWTAIESAMKHVILLRKVDGVHLSNADSFIIILHINRRHFYNKLSVRQQVYDCKFVIPLWTIRKKLFDRKVS